jgi:hypothetical protein
VRVVRLEHELLDPDLVPGVHPHHVVEEAAEDPPRHLADGSSVMTGSRSDHALLLVNTVSMRSSRKGIQPTWLSEKAIFSRGKRTSAPESSQSAMDM